MAAGGAARRGIVYGTSTATWQLADKEYAERVDHEAAILFTEDDLLWYTLKPTPEAALDFTAGDEFFAWAKEHDKLILAARRLLYETVEAVVSRYRGRVAGWVVVNEAIDANEADGLRRDYPWYETIGPSYLAESFRIAHEADRDAVLVLNEFGFETDDEFDKAADKRRNALKVVDRLLADKVPVHAFGVQAHLEAANFARRFDPKAYRAFLAELADRGLKILVTELDVLDDGLPADIPARDCAVADAYRRYLDAALQEPAVASVMTFGLSDRYTWLEEDYPREDGKPHRPSPSMRICGPRTPTGPSPPR